MKRMKCWSPLLVITCLTSIFAAAIIHAADPPRNWTSSDGKVIVGAYVGSGEGAVQILTGSGQTFTVPLDRLSPEDQAFVKERAEKGDPRIEFFGCLAEGDSVVFVIPDSKEWATGEKSADFERMKKELATAIERLPTGSKFQVICYAGPCWTLGKYNPEQLAQDWVPEGINGFYSYQGESGAYPETPLFPANPGTVAGALGALERLGVSPEFHDNWRSPCKMAIASGADVVFFLAIDDVEDPSDKQTTGSDVSTFAANQYPDAILYTFLLPTDPSVVEEAQRKLQFMAGRFGGTFTLIEEE